MPPKDDDVAEKGLSSNALALAASSYQSERLKAVKKIDPIILQWEKINLSIPIRGKDRKNILSNVTGEVKSGNISAIMGPTGSGKTSLLNVLSGRVQYVSGGSLTGRLLTNGEVRNESAFKRASAYVTQDDFLYAQLTVLETLSLAAHFALGSSLPPVEKESFVGNVIADLGLVKAKDTIIGDAMVKGVSGGERKRVSIGVELISNPSVLFLDEPTSGLDAFQALSVMSCMKELASTGRTIVAVIHQPRSSIFNMLDDLVLLSEGRTIYNGPAAQAHEWFTSNGSVCPPHSSPADYFLDVISKDYRTPKLEALSQQRITRLANGFQKYQEQMGESMFPLGSRETSLACCSMNTVMKTVSGPGETYGTNWFNELRYLTWRNFNVAARNTLNRVIITGINIIFGLLFGAIWSQRNTGQKGIQDKAGFLFMATISLAFAGAAENLLTFPIEKRIIQKERASGFYSLSAYYVSKVITSLPLALLGPILFCCISYPAVDLRDGAAHFLIFLGIMLLETLNAGALGMFLSTLAPDPEIAMAMAPAFNILFMIFNGVMINVDLLPKGSQWMAQISYIRWAFEALAINEFKDRSYACDANSNQQRCITNGNQVLQSYSYENGMIAWCVLWMVIIGLSTHSLAYFNLWMNATKYLKAKENDQTAAAVAESTDLSIPAAPTEGEEELALQFVIHGYVIPLYHIYRHLAQELNHDANGEESSAINATSMLPVPAVNVEWKDITFKIPVKKQGQDKYKTVLDDVSGSVESGTLTAIMGPTGSGKSSLLGVLAGRTFSVKGGELTGSLFTNGQPRDAAGFKQISAFVLQDDLLFGHLTVKETLLLAAHFALGSSMTYEGKQNLVAGVVKDLGLAKTINTIIGDERARGVSGGERKRVSIGVELISNPSVLFLDEPTSGLDSFQALSVMFTMNKLAKSGRTVVASIHQPRSAIYALLDRLILISEGETLYVGPAKHASTYFEQQGHPCPPLYNESDFFLDTISMDYRSAELEATTRRRINDLADAWAKGGSNDDDKLMETGLLIKGGPSNHAAPSSITTTVEEASPNNRGRWFSSLYYLTWRAFSSAYRNRFAIVLQLVLNLVFALMFGGIWSDVQNDQKAVQSIVGVLFTACVNICFVQAQAVNLSFPAEKVIIVKEQASNSYYLSAYYLSKFYSELPANLLGPCIFSVILYWTIQFDHELERFGIFVVVFYFLSLSAVAVGTLVSTIAPNLEAASALSPLFNVIFLIFGGILISVDSLPAGAKWVASCSPIHWAMTALARNEFKGRTFTCTPGIPCIETGEDVLSLYSWEKGSIGYSLLYITIIMTVFLTLGYLTLRQSLPNYMSVSPSSSSSKEKKRQE